MAEEKKTWEGKTRAAVAGATADQAWSLLKNYSNLRNLLPSIDTCSLVDGVDGTPGCVRHCTGPPVPSADGGEELVLWAKEKLVSMDHVGRRYSYEVVESNMGFGKYVATLAVEAEAEEESGGSGCVLEWSFEADPVAGWTEEGLVSYLETGLQAMAGKIGEEFKIGEIKV